MFFRFLLGFLYFFEQNLTDNHKKTRFSLKNEQEIKTPLQKCAGQKAEVKPTTTTTTTTTTTQQDFLGPVCFRLAADLLGFLRL